MNDELTIFRNALKNKYIPKYILCGIMSSMILSKSIFNHNDDIPEFLKEIINVEYKEYVIKSRTLIMARSTREIYNMSSESLFLTKNKLYEYIQKEIKKEENDK